MRRTKTTILRGRGSWKPLGGLTTILDRMAILGHLPVPCTTICTNTGMATVDTHLHHLLTIMCTTHLQIQATAPHQIYHNIIPTIIMLHISISMVMVCRRIPTITTITSLAKEKRCSQTNHHMATSHNFIHTIWEDRKVKGIPIMSKVDREIITTLKAPAKDTVLKYHTHSIQLMLTRHRHLQSDLPHLTSELIAVSHPRLTTTMSKTLLWKVNRSPLPLKVDLTTSTMLVTPHWILARKMTIAL